MSTIYKNNNELRSLAIIPARGNSKRIKNKNIIELGGKPLISYSIEAILSANCFDRIIVSTDSDEIASISRSYGAEVPFLRSAENATSSANLLNAISELLDKIRQFDGFVPDILGIFLPTSPFKNRSRIIEIFSQVLNGAQVGSLLFPVQLDLSTLFYENSNRDIVKWCYPDPTFRNRPNFLKNIFSITVSRIDWDKLLNWGITPDTPNYYKLYTSWASSIPLRYYDFTNIHSLKKDGNEWVYVAYSTYEEAIDINMHTDIKIAENICRKWIELND